MKSQARTFALKSGSQVAAIGLRLSRLGRWPAWAAKLAGRFGLHAGRVPYLGRIFLQPAMPVRQPNPSAGAPVFVQQFNWRPSWRWQLYQLNGGHTRPGENRRYYQTIYRQPPVERPAGSGHERVVAQQAAGPTFNLAPTTLQFLQPPAAPRSGGALRPPQQAILEQAIIQRLQPVWREQREQLFHQFLDRRQRVEIRPGQLRRIGGRQVVVSQLPGSSGEPYAQPLRTVFRRPEQLPVVSPTTGPVTLAPVSPSGMPANGPAPPLDLAKVTDQVMQQIDRRMTIWRERTGRV